MPFSFSINSATLLADIYYIKTMDITSSSDTLKKTNNNLLLYLLLPLLCFIIIVLLGVIVLFALDVFDSEDEKDDDEIVETRDDQTSEIQEPIRTAPPVPQEIIEPSVRTCEKINENFEDTLIPVSPNSIKVFFGLETSLREAEDILIALGYSVYETSEWDSQRFIDVNTPTSQEKTIACDIYLGSDAVMDVQPFLSTTE